MKRSLLLLSLLSVGAAQAGAVVIDFEGFSDQVVSLDNQYAADNIVFEAGNFVITGVWGPETNPFRTHSGIGLAGGAAEIAGNLTEGLTATDFSVWYSASGEGTQVSLFLDGMLVGQSAVGVANPNAPTLQLAVNGIEYDRFVISGTGDQFGVDDIGINTQAVPEPASMAALGLGGLALLRRRRKSA